MVIIIFLISHFIYILIAVISQSGSLFKGVYMQNNNNNNNNKMVSLALYSENHRSVAQQSQDSKYFNCNVQSEIRQ